MSGVWDHYDKIKNLPTGSVVIVCEPTKMQLVNDPDFGRVIDAFPGQYARVKFRAGGLWCEAEVDGKIRSVVFDKEDFGALEPKGSQE